MIEASRTIWSNKHDKTAIVSWPTSNIYTLSRLVHFPAFTRLVASTVSVQRTIEQRPRFTKIVKHSERKNLGDFYQAEGVLKVTHVFR